MSDTTSLHHIVISTKHRIKSIPDAVRDEMYRILASEIKNEGAYPIIINGIEDHIHILVDFGPWTSRAKLMKYIKHNSSIWAKKSGKFPIWEGWAREYYCYSLSFDRKQTVINYIKNQKDHHKNKTFEEELKEIFESMGKEWIDYDNSHEVAD